MEDEEIYDEGLVDQGWDFPDFFRQTPEMLRSEAYRSLERADLLEIERLLPDVEADIRAWRDNPGNDRYPYGESIAVLQGALGLENQDGIMGYETASTLMNRLTGEIEADLPGQVIVNILPYSALGALLYDVAGQEYAGYQGALDQYRVELQIAVEQANYNRLVDYVSMEYHACQIEEFNFEPEAYVQEFIQGLENGLGPEEMFTQYCQGWLEPLKPEDRLVIKEQFFENVNGFLTNAYIEQRERSSVPVAAEPVAETPAPLQQMKI